LAEVQQLGISLIPKPTQMANPNSFAVMKPAAGCSDAKADGRNTPNTSDAVVERGTQGSIEAIAPRVSNLEVDRATQQGR
jgi:hypothetical protein